MTSSATLRPGDAVLVRAIVDRVPVGASIALHVGNGLVLAAPCDIVGLAEPTPRFFRYRAAQIDAPLRFLAQDGDRLWLKGAAEPVTVPIAWVEEITPEENPTS